jgi:hypothetical protein
MEKLEFINTSADHYCFHRTELSVTKCTFGSQAASACNLHRARSATSVLAELGGWIRPSMRFLLPAPRSLTRHDMLIRVKSCPGSAAHEDRQLYSKYVPGSAHQGVCCRMAAAVAVNWESGETEPSQGPVEAFRVGRWLACDCTSCGPRQRRRP